MSWLSPLDFHFFHTDDESTPGQGGWGVADELIDDLAHMNELDLTGGFDLDAF